MGRGIQIERRLGTSSFAAGSCFRYNPTDDQASLQEGTPINTEQRNPPFTAFHSVTPQTPLESLNLNWYERDLPERERTKHVHRLHPYLGKFVPQLAEVFLRKFRPRLVCDPFCGSGTTLVEAAALGIPAVGSDISAFNCLVARVKTARYDLARLSRDVEDILQRVSLELEDGLFSRPDSPDGGTANLYLQDWYHPRALRQLLRYRALICEYDGREVLQLILSRAARSARLAKHYELDRPKAPQREPYHCFKHRRVCRPTEGALQFLVRYSRECVQRITAFQTIRSDVVPRVIAGDARLVRFPEGIDLVLTSPPYVGVIDYHEQHRYAYELLGLPTQAVAEIGPAFRGAGLAARDDYIAQIAQVFRNLQPSLAQGAVVVVVVNDRYHLYDGLPGALGFVPEQRLERQVNRRTGMRAGTFFESILIWRKAT